MHPRKRRFFRVCVDLRVARVDARPPYTPEINNIFRNFGSKKSAVMRAVRRSRTTLTVSTVFIQVTNRKTLSSFFLLSLSLSRCCNIKFTSRLYELGTQTGFRQPRYQTPCGEAEPQPQQPLAAWLPRIHPAGYDLDSSDPAQSFLLLLLLPPILF